MSNQWFRFYDDAVNDPKVQRLPAVLFKVWVNLLCLSSKNSGAIPPIEDAAFILRTDKKSLQKQIKELVSCGLVDECGSQLVPHNWNERQFKSDSSADRTRRYRERLKGSHGDNNVTSHVTRPDTETDTETDTEEEKRKATAFPKEAAVVKNSIIDDPAFFEECRKLYSAIPDFHVEWETMRGWFADKRTVPKRPSVCNWLNRKHQEVLEKEKNHAKTIGNYPEVRGREGGIQPTPGSKRERSEQATAAIIAKRNAEWAARTGQQVDITLADLRLPNFAEPS